MLLVQLQPLVLFTTATMMKARIVRAASSEHASNSSSTMIFI